jgi:hypothetical protein
VDREFERLMRLGYLEGPFEHGSRSAKAVNSILGVPKKDSPDKPRMCVNLTGSKVNEKLEFIKFLYPPFHDCTDLLYPGAWMGKVDLADFFSIGWYTTLAASILVSRFRQPASSGDTRSYPLASV